MGLFSFLGSLLGLNGGYGGPQKINILKNATSEGLPIIYGTRRVSPVNVFKIVSRDNAPIPDTGHGFDDIKSYGPDDGSETRQDEYKWLHRIGVWGQGEISGIEHYWVDGDSYRNRRFASKPFFRAATKFGREFQSAITYLSTASGGKWGADQVGREIAYSWLRFFNSEEDPQYNADPRVEARLQGLKIWDPRTHPNDPDEKSYSANRALVLLDYLMGDYGAGLRLDQIDLDTFIAAANICDQEQTIPAAPVNTTDEPQLDWDYIRGEGVLIAPGERLVSTHANQVGTSMPQYQCHAIVDPTQDVISNIKLLLKGMGWYMPWSNGKLKLIIEQAVDTPAMVFGEDDILGGWSITRGGRDNRLNRVTVDFPNANKDFENDTASWPAFNSDQHKALKAEDQGQDLHETVSLKTITNHYIAQIYAQYLVRKSRAAMRIDGLQLSPAALALEPGDVIGLNESHQNFFYNVTDPNDLVQDSLKDTGRWFIVEKVSISPTLDVTVSLIDYDSKVYGLEDPDDEPLRTYDGNPNLLAKPPAVKNLHADERTETVTSGIVYSAAFVTWEKPDLSSSALNEIILAWREIPETGEPGDFTQQMRLSPETTSAYISGLYDDRQYEIRVTYTTLLGRVSDPATYLIDLSAQEGTLTQVISAARAPESDDGQLGWTFIDLSTGDVYVKTNTGWGDPIANVAGEDGDRWHSGSSNPNNITVSGATAGDFYLETDTGTVYQLGETGWVDVANIRGSNAATLYLYQRAQSQPALPPDGMNYEFRSGYFFDSPASDWRVVIPNGTGPIWVTTVTVASNDLTITIAGSDWSTPAILAQDGADGIDGQPGANGQDGADGQDGQTTYTWIAYSKNSSGTSGFTTGAPSDDHTYVGIATNQTSSTEGTNPNSYIWSKWAGPTTLEELRQVTGWSSIPENGATRNNGQLADIDEVSTDFIVENAVTGFDKNLSVSENLSGGFGEQSINHTTPKQITTIDIPVVNAGPKYLYAHVVYEGDIDTLGNNYELFAIRGSGQYVMLKGTIATEEGVMTLFGVDPTSTGIGNLTYYLRVRAAAGQVLRDFAVRGYRFYGWEMKR